MPPLNPQDALSAVHRGLEWRWADVPLALADVASEAWALLLIALALYSWLDRDVKGVLKAFLPLALAVAAAAALALVARVAGAVPRPAADAHGFAVLLHRALPSGHVAAAAAFAAFSLLAYGRRGAAALVLALAATGARVAEGAGWGLEVAVGGAIGVTLAVAAYVTSLRLFPDGHLARLRDRRRGSRTSAVTADDPSP